MTVTTQEEMLQEVLDRFWETIPPVWNLVRNHLRSIAVENFDISVEQFHILRHIRRGVISVSELATVRQISRPAVSQTVDTLVEKGLITRQQDPGDRRFVNLALTPAGNDMLNKIFQKNRDWMREQLAALSPDEMNAISGALETIKAKLLDSLD